MDQEASGCQRPPHAHGRTRSRNMPLADPNTIIYEWRKTKTPPRSKTMHVRCNTCKKALPEWRLLTCVIKPSKSPTAWCLPTERQRNLQYSVPHSGRETFAEYMGFGP